MPHHDPQLPLDPDAPAPAERAHPLRPAVLLAIFCGGALGGPARGALGRAVPTATGHFPWGTLAANISGAFLLALLMVLVLEVWPPTRYLRPFAGIGFCGAYTTWSTFMVESDRLLGRGDVGLATAYVVATLTAGLLATTAGLTLGRAAAGRRRRLR